MRERVSAADEIFVSSIVLGELFYGAHKSARPKENFDEVQALMDVIPTLSCDPETARHYGLIKDRLRVIGRPLPENDIWIAAAAIQHGLTLATWDNHFRQVEGLSLAEF